MTNSAVFSENATGVELCLFDEHGTQSLIDIEHCENGIWHTHVRGLKPGQHYGYRMHGPWQPQAGHRFNAAKLLLDPYAKALSNVPHVSPAHYDYATNPEGGQLRSDIDSAPHQPKCIVVDETTQHFRHPRKKLADSLIYEMHVKGFSQTNPEIQQALRGKFGGLSASGSIDYLKAIGITAVELLPVHEFVDEPFVAQKGLCNYWGYNSISFFTPSLRYSCNYPTSTQDNASDQFRDMVRLLHDANIEVILDVVYNHTAEAGDQGPVFSFKGLDNKSYYILDNDSPQHYINDSGCGNSLNVNHPAVLRLVLDSLRYWVTEMGVDGFRFDLATSMGRSPQGYSREAAFFKALYQDPILSNVKMIAEPWDLGMGGYRLGQFPNGWSEWKDRYRDNVRKFWKGEQNLMPAFANSIHGASDLFEHQGRTPQAGINLITSHDGFTLSDLVSFETKHNTNNLENNADGHNHNYSFNCGIEGPSKDSEILELRAKYKRNLLTTLLFSQGVPMLTAGDEFGRSQQGNNNNYCQDNESSWLDWENIDLKQLSFFKRLVSLRNQFPEFRCTRFVHGKGDELGSDLDEINWYHTRGTLMTQQDWHNSSLQAVGLMLNGKLIFENQDSNLLYLVFNAGTHAVKATLPEVPTLGRWICELTSASAPQAGKDPTMGRKALLEEASVSLFRYLGENN